MKIEDILQALPSREDIIQAIGLQSRASTSTAMFTAAEFFGAGIILGAGLALLFAPKPGHAIRHDIAERVGGMAGHLRQTQAAHAQPNGPTV